VKALGRLSWAITARPMPHQAHYEAHTEARPWDRPKRRATAVAETQQQRARREAALLMETTMKTYDPRLLAQRLCRTVIRGFAGRAVRCRLELAGSCCRRSRILFHPNQIVEDQHDGSVIVRFRCGGAREMCWHLFTWGSDVTMVSPARLRRELARAIGAVRRGVEMEC
jgi:hypothetical protein